MYFPIIIIIIITIIIFSSYVDVGIVHAHRKYRSKRITCLGATTSVYGPQRTENGGNGGEDGDNGTGNVYVNACEFSELTHNVERTSLNEHLRR